MGETLISEVEQGLWRLQFSAMKSPCEVFIECQQKAKAEKLLQTAAEEAWRIEQKFSRFNPQSVIGKLNQQSDQWVAVDAETEALLDFADQCWQISGGLIDVTVGHYFQLWKFDGQTPPPTRKQLKSMAQFVGWQKVKRTPGRIFLPKGMQLDLGGIGKEYAVDKVATELSQSVSGGILVNFGGDIRAMRPRIGGQPWQVGVEALSVGQGKSMPRVIPIKKGAIATSGNTYRYVVDKHGRTLGHILHPKTGWPISSGPASVTVIGDTAIQAGLIATLAMLKGKQAETFLTEQKVPYFCQRSKG